MPIVTLNRSTSQREASIHPSIQHDARQLHPIKANHSIQPANANSISCLASIRIINLANPACGSSQYQSHYKHVVSLHSPKRSRLSSSSNSWSQSTQESIIRCVCPSCQPRNTVPMSATRTARCLHPYTRALVQEWRQRDSNSRQEIIAVGLSSVLG